MVTDNCAHAYPWLHDCNCCTCVQTSWLKLSVQKLSAISGIIDGVVFKSNLEKAKKGAANVDWFCIPPDKRIVDGLMALKKQCLQNSSTMKRKTLAWKILLSV